MDKEKKQEIKEIYTQKLIFKGAGAIIVGLIALIAFVVELIKG